MKAGAASPGTWGELRDSKGEVEDNLDALYHEKWCLLKIKVPRGNQGRDTSKIEHYSGRWKHISHILGASNWDLHAPCTSLNLMSVM